MNTNDTPRAGGSKPTRRRGKRRRTRGDDPLLRQVRRERARFELTLGAIRAALEDEPSPAAVHACARRWERAIHQAAAEVIQARNTAKEVTR